MDDLRKLQGLLYLEFQDRYYTDEIFFRKENTIMFQSRDVFNNLTIEKQGDFADFVTREIVRQRPDLLEYLSQDCVDALKASVLNKIIINQTGIANCALVYRELPNENLQKEQIKNLIQIYKLNLNSV